MTFYCPRDGGELTAKYAQPRGLRPGRRVARAPQVTGWWCEEGHALNLGEQPVEAE